MDDMVIFGDSVKNLKNIFDEVDHFCLEKLALFLKAPVFGKTFRGVPFLGWRITKLPPAEYFCFPKQNAE